MAITRVKKESIIAAVTDALSKSASAVFVSFTKLTVSEVNGLRAELKKDAVKYTVVKKTLLKRALDSQGIEGDMPDMPGEVALVYLKEGDDITAPARGLATFVKKMKGKIAYLGGVINKKYLSQLEIVGVSMIPPTLVLRGMFVNIINSPIQRFAIAMSGVAKTKA